MTRINRDDVVISYDLFRVDEEALDIEEDLDEVLEAVGEMFSSWKLTPEKTDKVTAVAKKIFAARREFVITRNTVRLLAKSIVENNNCIIEIFQKNKSMQEDFKKVFKKAKADRGTFVRQLKLIEEQKPIYTSIAVIKKIMTINPSRPSVTRFESLGKHVQVSMRWALIIHQKILKDLQSEMDRGKVLLRELEILEKEL